MANCEVKIPSVPNLEDNVLTVGRIFTLECQGVFPKSESFSNWQIVPAENMSPYALKIFSSRFIKEDLVEFQVTSYVAGPQDIKKLKLKNGEQELELSNIKFDVQSVIGQQEATVEPFGPMVLSLPWPSGLWVFISVTIIVILLTIVLKVQKHLQRKSLIEELRQHDSALPPLAEVHQHYRRWRRENSFFFGSEATEKELQDFLNELDQAYKLFITRMFKIPALKWSDRLIFNDLKKYQRAVFNAHSFDMRRFSLELNKAMNAKNIKPQDVIQLTENLRVLAEKIDQFQKGNKR